MTSLFLQFTFTTAIMVGKAISIDLSEISCGLNEMPCLCHNTCEQTCNNAILEIATPYPCKDPCIPGCECIEDHVRDHQQACVPASQCSPVYCGDNESPVLNDNLCERTCSSMLSGEEGPAAPCYATPNRPGCDCGPGFYRDDNNYCVGELHCSPCVGTNEEYKSCMPNCYLTCLHRTKPFCPISSHTCTKGCVCTKGHYRNIYGICVTAEECLAFD